MTMKIIWQHVVSIYFYIAFFLFTIDCRRVEYVEVDSRFFWTNSSRTYDSGETLYLKVIPTNQTWHDWYIETDAEGYTNYFNVKLRYQRGNIFALICCVQGAMDTCAYIGKENVFQVTKTAGYLSCFANDNPYMYWNNRGSINVGIFQT